MPELHVWIRDRATGTYAGELDSTTTQAAIDAFTAALPASREALDKATNARPPMPAAVADPLVAQYTAAATVADKVDVIARRLGLR